MSHIHVLTGSGTQWSMVMHFPIPEANNDVGVSYRTALVNSELGGTTQLTEGTEAGQITPAEKALIESGGVYEYLTSFKVEGNGATPTAVQANFRRKYTRESALVLADLQAKLKYFGHTEEET